MPDFPFRRAAALATLAVISFGSALAATPSQSATRTVRLIPRSVLFGNPDRTNPQISPDGTRISFVAPVNGVLNVWVAPADNLKKARAVTSDRKRGVTSYMWAYDNRHLIYLRDKNGDENAHVYSVDLKSGSVKDLTPGENIQARIQEVSPKFPGMILVGINDRNPQLHDIWRVDLETGEKKQVFRNDAYLGVMTDEQFRPRVGVAFRPDFSLAVKDVTVKPARDLLSIGPEDVMTTNPVAFDKSATSVFMLDSRKRDKAALVKRNLKTGESTVLAEAKQADISGLLQHPTEKTIQAVQEEYHRKEWRVLDRSIERDLAALRRLGDGDIAIPSRSRNDKKWIVALDRDNGPVTYYLYDRPTRKARKLFVSREDLVGLPLAKMKPVTIPARDALGLVSYLTLPVGADRNSDGLPEKPLPMVLWIHGGPWSRDTWGYDPIHQWLANRGYAVLSVNYRGSTGFGKRFINAANREWGGKMHQDILDAVDWAVKRKIADPKRVAITGGSYGGYETLVGMTSDSERFACGVDIFGPSNLVTWMNNIPPYWMPILPLIRDRVGDVSSEEGREFLESRSPLFKVDNIRKPLLVAQGANDPRVPRAESDQLVRVMNQKSIPVTYVVFADEGHGLERPQNRLAFFSVMESFLAKHLGGRAEPIGGALAGSGMSVEEGAAHVPGLAAAASRRQ